MRVEEVWPGELDTGPWRPDVDVHPEWMVGRKWPIIIVALYETNQMNERRWIGTRSFSAYEEDEEVRVATNEEG